MVLGRVVNEGKFYLDPRRDRYQSDEAPIFAYAREHGVLFPSPQQPGPSPDEVVGLAGLGWAVRSASVYGSLPGNLPGLGGLPAPGYQALIRADTDEVLSVVTTDYAPIQNHEAARAVLHLARQASETWHIGSAYPPMLVAAAPYGRSQSQGVYVVDLGLSEKTRTCLVARNGHGHGGALTIDLVEIGDRGLVMPLDVSGTGSVKIRESHLGRVQDRLNFSPRFTEAWGDKLLDVLVLWAEVSEWLVDEDDCESLVGQLWPGDHTTDPKPSGNPTHPRDFLLGALSGVETVGMAYLVICEYIDQHSEARERGDATKNRLERQAAGAGTKMKERALDWLVERAAPVHVPDSAP